MDCKNHGSGNLNPHAHSAVAHREQHHAIDSEDEESPASDIGHDDKNTLGNQEFRTERQSPMSFTCDEADPWMAEDYAEMEIPAGPSGYWRHRPDESRGGEEQLDKLSDQTTRPNTDAASMGFALNSHEAAHYPRSRIHTSQLHAGTAARRAASQVHETPRASINTEDNSAQKAQTLGARDSVRERQSFIRERARDRDMKQAMDDVRREEEAQAWYQEGQRIMANGDLDQDGGDGGICEWIWDPLPRAHRDEEQWSAYTSDGFSYHSGGSEGDDWSPVPCALQPPRNMFELEADSRHEWRVCRAQACEEETEAHGALNVTNREDYVPYAPEQ